MATPRNYRIIYYKFINQFNQCTGTFSVEKTGKNESETSEFKNQHKGNHSEGSEWSNQSSGNGSETSEWLNQHRSNSSETSELLKKVQFSLSEHSERIPALFTQR